jgi:hypothetical protein
MFTLRRDLAFRALPVRLARVWTQALLASAWVIVSQKLGLTEFVQHASQFVTLQTSPVNRERFGERYFACHVHSDLGFGLGVYAVYKVQCFVRGASFFQDCEDELLRHGRECGFVVR